MLYQAHKKITHQLMLMLFLCATMLSVQLATLNHSTEHQFHKYHELCDSFLVFEHNATSLSLFILPVSIEQVVGKTDQPISNPQQQAIIYRAIRAPPA